VIDSIPALAQFKNQLLIDITVDGLRIQIVDEQNRPMFNSGSAALQPYTRVILREIAKVVNDVRTASASRATPTRAPNAGGEHGYSNWELSADRANASRRELMAGGMDEKKIRPRGRTLLIGIVRCAGPHNPINRRISIIVMNQHAEAQAAKDATAPVVASPRTWTPEAIDGKGADR
jgi:chemotaxis protein MotB